MSEKRRWRVRIWYWRPRRTFLLGMVVGSEYIEEEVEAISEDVVVNKLLNMRLRVAKDNFYIPWHNVIGVEITEIEDD